MKGIIMQRRVLWLSVWTGGQWLIENTQKEAINIRLNGVDSGGYAGLVDLSLGLK